MHIPIHLVMAGARILKNEIAQRLRASDLDGMAASIATQYVCNLFDLAIEQMSRAFMRDINRGARNDEAYRLFALGQNISTERERQRAALLEWSQAVLIGLHYRAPEQVLPRLAASEFGLWLQHKGGVLFERRPRWDRSSRQWRGSTTWCCHACCRAAPSRCRTRCANCRNWWRASSICSTACSTWWPRSKAAAIPSPMCSTAASCRR
ncbi:hypothetical protein WJ967_26385 [Achromobacter xylosoxidans]